MTYFTMRDGAKIHAWVIGKGEPCILLCTSDGNGGKAAVPDQGEGPLTNFRIDSYGYFNILVNRWQTATVKA